MQLQNFSGLVGAAAAAVQGSARNLVDLTAGSTLRAILEASASIGLWVQWLIVQVLQTTRAATSAGGDLDSWVGDFGVTRLPAMAASGIVTFSRYSTTGSALIAPGTALRSTDGTLLFTVTADPTRAAWSATQNAYVMAAGVASLDVPATALAPGAGGNVQASAITLIAAPLAGVDTVTNAAAFQGGIDAESDAALRARFSLFLDSRTRATPAAIAYAVGGVQQGLSHALLENQTSTGAPMIGSFTVVVDDGTGSPSASLLASVSAAIEAVRPIGAIYAVQAPGVVPVTVSISIDTDPAANPGTVRDAVAAAITGYVDTLGLGAAVLWSKLFQVAYAASPAVTRVGAATLNGAAADLAIPTASVAKTSSVTVS